MRQTQQLENGEQTTLVVPKNALSRGAASAGDMAGNGVNKVYKSKPLRWIGLGALIATGGIVSCAAGAWDGATTAVSGTREGLEEGIDKVTGGEGANLNITGPEVQIGETEVGGNTFGVTPAGEAPAEAAIAPAGASGEVIPQEVLVLGAGAVILECGVSPNYEPVALQAQWDPIYNANQTVVNQDVQNPGLDAGDAVVCP